MTTWTGESDRPFVAAVFFHRQDVKTVAHVIEDLLHIVAEIVPSTPIAFYFGTEVETFRLTRARRLTPATAKDLTDAVAAGQFREVTLSELSLAQLKADKVGTSLELRLVEAPGLRIEHQFPLEVGLVAPLEALVRRDSALEELGCIWELLDSPLGCVDAYDSWGGAWDEIGAMGGGSYVIGKRRTDLEELRGSQLERAWLKRPVVGQDLLRGAYWGMFLGPHFVARLGGVAAIEAQSPCEVVTALEGGGARMQLTSRIEDALAPGYVERLRGLQAYLEPLLPPGLSEG
jgi:hypothetical protein